MTATYALIPAAGRGARFSTDAGNKVFLPLRGVPILRRTVAAFQKHPGIDGIVVVTGADDLARARGVLSGMDKVLAVVAGGADRQASVSIGLFALGADPDDIILVHDGARPLISADVIDRCIAGVRAKGSAVAAVPVHDTLKRAETHLLASQVPPEAGGLGVPSLTPLPLREGTGVGSSAAIISTVPRDNLWAVQTPQAFPFQTLLNAYVAARDSGFQGTDEASLVERMGTVHLVMGDPANLKITRPEDMQMAEAILDHRTPPMQTRIGFGYDVHRLKEGRALVLGGVSIPTPGGRGLDGHSDADVLLHALCDALLGAAGLPDIGNLYPNTDAKWAGVSSLLLLADVRERVNSAGFTIVNVDMTLIAEAPKIAPHIPAMREAISQTLHISPAQVGIKATTHEGLGAIGNGEGMAAHAVASLSAHI